MSDPDVPPDPLDAAYAQAESALSDEAARAARRARVLAAVASEYAGAQAALPDLPPPARRSRGALWGGWLAAASVAGLSLFAATRVYQPSLTRVRTPPQAAPESAPAAPVAATPAPPKIEAAKAPPAAAPAPSPVAAPRPPPPPAALFAPQAFPAASPPPPPRPAPAPSSAAGGFAGVQQRLQPPAPPARVAPPPRPGLPTVRIEAPSPADQAAALRAAAAAGQLDDVETLLAQGVPVDAADSDGNTALMRSIQADQPAIAAVLQNHGASLDLRNSARQSARDMAAAAGDPALSRALGLDP